MALAAKANRPFDLLVFLVESIFDQGPKRLISCISRSFGQRSGQSWLPNRGVLLSNARRFMQAADSACRMWLWSRLSLSLPE